jgi:hypothetical protein
MSDDVANLPALAADGETIVAINRRVFSSGPLRVLGE